MATRWDSSSGGSLASQRAPAVLDAIAHTDPRTTAHGWQHIGPVCATWHCLHPSCEVIRADADEHDAHAERPLFVLGVLTELGDRVRAERGLVGHPAITYQDCIGRMPGTPPHGPTYGLPCRHPTCCSGVTTQRTIPVAPSIRAERELLTRQLDWIARQDWIVDFRDQVRELRNQLMATNRNRDEQPLPGTCPRPVDDKGTECGGELWPHYVEHSTSTGAGVDDSPWRPEAVVCKRNPSHRWETARDVARLSLVLKQRAEAEKLHATPAGPTSAGLTPPDRLQPVLEQQRHGEAQEGESTP